MDAPKDLPPIPIRILKYFGIEEQYIFRYGDDDEHFGSGFHKVPTTVNLWVAGNRTAFEVVITYSAMEAVAFLTLQAHRYPRFENLAFIAIGNKLSGKQLAWIRQQFPKRKFTLVFDNDLSGIITAIKVAAGIKKLPISCSYSNGKVIIRQGKKTHVFDEDRLSFDAYKRAFGFRGNIRTRKAPDSFTFLEQLKNDTFR